MTLLVKNEAELLETNLRFHHAMGVDAFVVTDNGSTDATPDIIRRYVEKGWIVAHIVEPDTGYHQKEVGGSHGARGQRRTAPTGSSMQMPMSFGFRRPKISRHCLPKPRPTCCVAVW